MKLIGLSILMLAVLPVLPVQALDETVKPARSVRVALCQILCLDGDRSGNLLRIENALVEAKAGHADIACFPETALLGWVNPEAHEKAQPIPGTDTEHLAALAKKYGLWICCGLAEKSDEELHDSAVLIDPRGEIVLKHRKINICAGLMTPEYVPGTEMNTVETPWGRVGILICADSFKEALLQRMAVLKPDLVLIPYGWAAPVDSWPAHGKQLENTVCNAARVIDAPVIGTDLVGAISHGPWKGFVYGGQSLAVDRSGNVLKMLRDRDREVLVVEVALSPTNE